MYKKSLLYALALILITLATGYASTWDGWIYQDPYPTSNNLFDVNFITPSKGWITGKHGLVLYTEDGGETWEAQESGTREDLMRLHFVDELSGWAVGKGGTIIHTKDGGKTWSTQINVDALLTKVFFLDEKEGWVTGATPEGVVYHTKDGGKTWRKQATGVSRAIGSIHFLNPQTGWILAGEEVYRTLDGGKKWEKSMLPLRKISERYLPGGGMYANRTDDGLGPEWWQGDIVFTNERQGWAVVNKWFVFYTQDGGKTWKIQLDTGDMSYGFSHIDFRDTENGCVSGSTIFCTDDGGKTWRERLGVDPGDGRALGGISLSGKSAGWAVGNSGQIWKTNDDGRAWNNIKKSNECGDIPLFVNDKTGWLYSGRRLNRLCRTNDGGVTWEKQNVGMRVWDVFFLDDSTGWAVGAQEDWKNGKETNRTSDVINVWGIIKHTTDGGKTWKIQHKQHFGRDAYAGFYSVSFLAQDKGWVTGKRGIILYTEDGGRNWSHEKQLLTPANLTEVQFGHNGDGFILGTHYNDSWNGHLINTKNNGKSWKLVKKFPDVGLRDLYFITNEESWLIGNTESEEGVLLYTNDGGKTWTEKLRENIYFARIAFIEKVRGVIYCPEAGLLLITKDGGKTWKRSSLPLKKYPWHFSEIFRSVGKE